MDTKFLVTQDCLALLHWYAMLGNNSGVNHLVMFHTVPISSMTVDLGFPLSKWWQRSTELYDALHVTKFKYDATNGISNWKWVQEKTNENKRGYCRHKKHLQKYKNSYEMIFIWHSVHLTSLIQVQYPENLAPKHPLSLQPSVSSVALLVSVWENLPVIDNKHTEWKCAPMYTIIQCTIIQCTSSEGKHFKE